MDILSEVDRHFYNALKNIEGQPTRKFIINHADKTTKELLNRFYMDKNTQEKTGTREHFYPKFELLTPEIFERMAKVMTSGAEKYGEKNWQNFTPELVQDIQRHAFMHIMQYMQGDKSEDHLANCACNLMMLAWYEARQNDVLQKETTLNDKEFLSYEEYSGILSSNLMKVDRYPFCDQEGCCANAEVSLVGGGVFCRYHVPRYILEERLQESLELREIVFDGQT